MHFPFINALYSFLIDAFHFLHIFVTSPACIIFVIYILFYFQLCISWVEQPAIQACSPALMTGSTGSPDWLPAQGQRPGTNSA